MNLLLISVLLARLALVVSTPPVVFTFPIPQGCSAAVVGANVVYTCAPVVAPPQNLTINKTVALPQGKVGAPYSADLAPLANPKGGVAPYSFRLTGTVPAWLTLSPTGILSGTPSTAGTFTLSFSVTDSSGTAQKFEGVILNAQVTQVFDGCVIGVTDPCSDQ